MTHGVLIEISVRSFKAAALISRDDPETTDPSGFNAFKGVN